MTTKLFFAVLTLLFFGNHTSFAAVIIKIGDVSVNQSPVTQIVQVPFFAFADPAAPGTGFITLAGLNWNVDVGNDGGGVLPTGIDFTFPLPDTGRIASGGQTAQAGWAAITTIDANLPAPGDTQPLFPLSDLAFTGNAGALNEIPLGGNTTTLTGGVHVFDLNVRVAPNVLGVIPFQFHREMNGELPFTSVALNSGDAFNSFVLLDNDQFSYLPGSLSIVAVPEPTTVTLTLAAVGFGIASLHLRRKRRV